MRSCPRCGAKFSATQKFCGTDGVELIDDPDDGELDDLVGRIIEGRYRLLYRLGEGSGGVVYKARHTRIPRLLAVKILRPSLAKSRGAIERFRREVGVQAKLDHPNIVEVMDFGYAPEVGYYMVMEFLQGEPLCDRLEREEELGILEIFKIVEQCARALQVAHDHGVIHRDVKAENLFLVGRGNDEFDLRLVDFGLAKINDTEHFEGFDARYCTYPGEMVGTPYTMSPEQIAAGNVDHRSDLYSLGVLFYELLTGAVPFDAESPHAIVRKHLVEKPRPPSQQPDADWIPPALDELVLSLLAKEPDDRPANARAFLQALEQLRLPAYNAWADAHMVESVTHRTKSKKGKKLKARGRPKLVPVSPKRAEPLREVLVVDDEAAVGFLLRQHLAREGYACSHAHNVEEARAWLREHPRPFAIIVDLILPGRDGLSFLRELSQIGYRGLVIVCSGLESREIREEALRLGANAVLTKVEVHRLPQLLAAHAAAVSA